MAKPICVMYIPFHFALDNKARRQTPSELMRILNGFDDDNKIKPTTYWRDYYWFVFHKDDITEPEIQCFYEKDFTPIKFEELKKFIEDSLKKD